MRLDRYVSQGLGVPRKHALTMCKSFQVKVNGVVQRDAGAQIVLGRDVVHYRDELVREPGHRLIMLHKPAGVVTSTEPGPAPIVMDLLPKELQHRELAPVGRLDKDTTGLLLLTTDGGLAHALLHPRRHVEKAYVVWLDADLPVEAEAQVAAGLALDANTVCAPAALERLGPKQVRLVLREGRFHQVKRMMAVLGRVVLRLHRERIGGLVLPPDLAEGQARPLTPDEVALLGLVSG
jgi:16S rRNA pseudouridine516 synthase